MIGTHTRLHSLRSTWALILAAAAALLCTDHGEALPPAERAAQVKPLATWCADEQLRRVQATLDRAATALELGKAEQWNEALSPVAAVGDGETEGVQHLVEQLAPRRAFLLAHPALEGGGNTLAVRVGVAVEGLRGSYRGVWRFEFVASSESLRLAKREVLAAAKSLHNEHERAMLKTPCGQCHDPRANPQASRTPERWLRHVAETTRERCGVCHATEGSFAKAHPTTALPGTWRNCLRCHEHARYAPAPEQFGSAARQTRVAQFEKRTRPLADAGKWRELLAAWSKEQGSGSEAQVMPLPFSVVQAVVYGDDRKSLTDALWQWAWTHPLTVEAEPEWVAVLEVSRARPSIAAAYLAAKDVAPPAINALDKIRAGKEDPAEPAAEVIRRLTALATDAPDFWPGVHLLANARQAAGQWDEARVALEGYLKTQPNQTLWRAAGRELMQLMSAPTYLELLRRREVTAMKQFDQCRRNLTKLGSYLLMLRAGGRTLTPEHLRGLLDTPDLLFCPAAEREPGALTNYSFESVLRDAPSEQAVLIQCPNHARKLMLYADGRVDVEAPPATAPKRPLVPAGPLGKGMPGHP